MLSSPLGGGGGGAQRGGRERKQPRYQSWTPGIEPETLQSTLAEGKAIFFLFPSKVFKFLQDYTCRQLNPNCDKAVKMEFGPTAEDL